VTKTILFMTASLISLATPAAATERMVCTLAKEIGATAPILDQGNCADRISSASTFKIAISLMGFDSGILTSSDIPKWPFKEGYTAWNPKWKQATTPQTWMRDSVVWYSQKITEKLGGERFAAYVDKFDYGNEDITGDKGKRNGLTHAWLSSSLKISPKEQVAFLTRMVEGKLPVSASTVMQTKRLMDNGEQTGGWHVYGKTGAGLPFGEDGELLKGQPFGWYVGWAEKDGRKVVFARLVRFNERPARKPGPIARDGLLNLLFAPDGILN
jgi:beta-lactamase class D